jgi:hypothetical protein
LADIELAGKSFMRMVYQSLADEPDTHPGLLKPIFRKN